MEHLSKEILKFAKLEFWYFDIRVVWTEYVECKENFTSFSSFAILKLSYLKFVGTH